MPVWKLKLVIKAFECQLKVVCGETLGAWKFSKAGTFFWQVVCESVCKQIYHCFLFTTSTLNMIQFHICQTTICGIFPLFLKPLTNCLQCFLKQAFDRPALVLTAPVESKCVLSTSLTSSWQNCNLTKDFTFIIAPVHRVSNHWQSCRRKKSPWNWSVLTF